MGQASVNASITVVGLNEMEKLFYKIYVVIFRVHTGLYI